MGSQSPIDTFRFLVRFGTEDCTLVLCMPLRRALPAASLIDPSPKLTKIQVSTSASGCILLTLHPSFLGLTFRKSRALMHTCFGLSAVLFISHSIFLYGFAIQKRRLGIEWMALMALLNIAGAVVYASRVRIVFGDALFRLACSLQVTDTGALVSNSF